MPEPNTVETNNEPTLDQFNDTAATQQSAASEPAAADTTQTQQTSQAQQTSKPAAGQPAQQQTQQQTPADPYATVLDGLQIPQGLEIDNQLVTNLKAVAKQYNISAEGVKALLQLDMNNNAASMMAEDKLVADAQARWAEENKAKYGDNLKNVETNCSRVLAELDKEGKFKELLATAGVSGHPATLGFLKTIGDLYLEKASVNPNATVSTDEEVELENFN